MLEVCDISKMVESSYLINKNGSSNYTYGRKMAGQMLWLFILGVFERLQFYLWVGLALVATQVFCMIAYSNYMLQFTVSVSSEHV